MPAAPSLAVLFEFENQIEPAVVGLLSAAAAGVLAVRERSTEVLTTPRYEVKLQMGMPTGQAKALPGGLFHPSQTLPSAFHAQLVVSTVTNRKSVSPPNGARHDELVGKARIVMLLGVGTINAGLTYLAVRQITSAGVLPVVQASADLDVSPEVFNLQFTILPDAWPALPTAS